MAELTENSSRTASSAQTTPYKSKRRTSSEFYSGMVKKYYPDATPIDDSEYDEIIQNKKSRKEVHDDLTRRGYSYIQYPIGGDIGTRNGYYNPQRNTFVLDEDLFGSDFIGAAEKFEKNEGRFSADESKRLQEQYKKNTLTPAAVPLAKRAALAAQQKLADARAKKGEFMRDLSDRMQLNKKKNE